MPLILADGRLFLCPIGHNTLMKTEGRMIKGRELLGLAVWRADKKQVIGRISDIAVAADGKILGILVECGGVFSRSIYIKSEDIGSIGNTGVVVRGQHFAGNVPKLNFIGRNRLIGSRPSGLNGRITDIVVDDGKVIGMEISQGLIRDLQRGRSFISWQDVQNLRG